ncbi:MAG: hypothetical protein IPL61_00100 [Myxococcales bacterium]|nr:hypothetical protein [Myxococcales bacterium]
MLVRFAPALLVVALVAPAHADVSKKVIAAFKGKVLLSTAPLEPSGDDKATIAAYKSKVVTTLQGHQNGNDVQEWTFNYTAFLSRTGATSLKLEFYDGDKYSADRTLTGIDPKDPVLEGDITIDEDEGLTKGKKYTVKLVGKIKGKETTVAQTVVTMN